VVIDDVEKHHQPTQMRLVDQGSEIVGASVSAVGRVPQNAVIAPIARTSEIRERHQFERGYPGRHQMIEPADHRAVGTFRCEGPDVRFKQHGFMPWASTPIPGAPLVSAVVDYLAGARGVVGLERGGRIGDIDLIVDPEFVAAAGFCAWDVGAKPAVIAAPQGVRILQLEIDAFGRRRP
jgi:hypothetical protein